MHHLVIGAFVFSVGDNTPISKMNRVTKGRFSEVALVNGATSEDTGRPLETISLSAKWVRERASENVQVIRNLIDTPQQVSDGDGFNLGRWTISSLTEGKSELIHNGKAQVTELSLDLLEKRE
ncbi:phage tail protein [Vibrio splendidus]|uniref:phage tail protein n=1 Tax=Vibrio splendidus TaxID=29497 RepID=UPI000C8564C3|nr:phage tail protein [Vibrio splendidus]PMI49579.1 hypothetical protein BCU42_14390 [Vibrio splendidus]